MTGLVHSKSNWENREAEITAEKGSKPSDDGLVESRKKMSERKSVNERHRAFTDGWRAARQADSGKKGTKDLIVSVKSTLASSSLNRLYAL